MAASPLRNCLLHKPAITAACPQIRFLAGSENQSPGFLMPVSAFWEIILGLAIMWGVANLFMIDGASLGPVFAMGLIPLAPVRKLLQGLVERLSPHEAFDSYKLLSQYTQNLSSIPPESDLILKLLLKYIDEALTPEHVFVFIADTAEEAFKIHAQTGKRQIKTSEARFELSDDLARWLEKTGQALQLQADKPAGSAPLQISGEELARLEQLEIALCVPLPGTKQLIGWLALGPKKSNQTYSDNNLVLLATLASQTAAVLEKALLLRQTDRRTAELEALQDISAKIHAEPEPSVLLAALLEQAAHLLQADGGMVFLLEPDHQRLKLAAGYKLGEDYGDNDLQVGDDVAGQVVAVGKSMTVDNYRDFPKRTNAFREAQFGAVLGVPLRWEGKIRGVLQLVRSPGMARFNEHDIWLAEFLTMESAVALEKSRLLQEAQQRADQLATLSEVSIAISSTLDLEVALQRIMDRAVQILHAEAGSLLLVDLLRKELTFEVVLGPTGSDLRGMKTSIGKGIVGTVAQTGKPIIVNDVATDPRWNIAFDEATDFQTKNILCVPMIDHDRQVIGVIELINKQDGTVFSQVDSNLLLSFAAQAAIAIENARVFTRTDKALAERIQELQALQMFDQQLQNSLELNTVLDMTLTHAMDALGISMGIIGILKSKGEPGLYLLTQRGMPTEMGRYKIDPWPLTRGVLGRVARTGDLAWVNNMAEAKDYVPKNHRTRSFLVIPITREERVIGVIDLESTDPDYFTSDDVFFVQRLVNHAAIAIANAQLFEQVRQANNAKSEFMSIASHELKIPMTSIKGYAKLIQMGAAGGLSDKQMEFLNVISNNVDRMDRLVRDLLDVSRIEAGSIRLEIENVQICKVIEEVIETVRTQIENKRLTLEVDVDRNLPEIRGDYGRIMQILTNLISNAYKYTPEGGQIRVMAKPHQNGDVRGIEVAVQDTGFGISEEDQAQLFANFFRSGDQNIRNEPGTGLGLAITKKMIESHGGELTFESELGRGSTFTFTLPLVNKIPPGVEVVEK